LLSQGPPASISDISARGFNEALVEAFAEAFKGSPLEDPFAASVINLDSSLAALPTGNLRTLGWLLLERAVARALPAVPAITRFHQLVLCVVDHLSRKR
jgi:hypothetical protein